jgi:hypothetical protein
MRLSRHRCHASTDSRCHAQVAERVREIGFDLERAAVAGRGRIALSKLQQRIAQIVVHFGQYRLQLQRPAVDCDRIIEAPAGSQCVGQVDHGPAVTRSQFECSVVTRHRATQVTTILQRAAHVVVRFGVIGE